MQSIKKILATTDLSELSLTGVRYALETAESQGAEVIVYHVVGFEEMRLPYEGFYTESLARSLPEERKKALADLLADHFSDLIGKVRLRQEVEIGVPHAKIVEKAAKENVDLIAMCTHGRTGPLHMLLGSVTEKVVRRAACPVLTLRPAKEERSAAINA
jgi:nucleotide-binding universal stress UspA family protein